MKKTYFVLLVSILSVSITVSILVLGCTSPKASQSESVPSDIPEWYFNPPQQDDVIFGTGSANIPDMQMAITMAESRARQSIAITLNTNVQAMITDYIRNAGNLEHQSNSTFAETISRQLTKATLTGTIIIRREQGKDRTIYVLAALKKADAARAAADIIDNEASLYAEFKAMDALKRMEAQLDKSDIKPTPIDN